MPSVDQVAGKYKNALSGDAEDYVNDSSIELKWAERAYKQAEVHYNLLTSLRPSKKWNNDSFVAEKYAKNDNRDTNHNYG